MAETKVPEPFASILKAYFNVGTYTSDWWEKLASHRDREHFRRQLANTIIHRSVSKENYELLTDEDFDTQDNLQRPLEEVWKGLYGDADPRFEA